MRGLIGLAVLVANSATSVAQSSQPGRTLRAIVVDADAQPVAGARVKIQWYGGGVQGVSDDTGRVALKIEHSRATGLILHAFGEGSRAQATRTLPADPEELDQEFRLQLTPAARKDFTVKDGSGDPVAGAEVGIIGEHFYHLAFGTTDHEGKTTLWIPADAQVDWVFAREINRGFDYRSFVIERERRADRKAERPKVPGRITLTIEEASPIRVKVVDDRDQPVPDIPVQPWLLSKSGEAASCNLSAIGERVTARTDKAGTVVFKWLPPWQESKILTFFAHSDDHVGKRLDFELAKGADATFRLSRLIKVSGQALKPDGTPAPDIRLQFSGRSYVTGRHGATATTDAQGNYSTRLAPETIYMGTVLEGPWTATPVDGLVVSRDNPPANINFQLRKATRVTGRVTTGRTPEPQVGQMIEVYQYGSGPAEAGVPLANPNNVRRSIRPSILRRTQTDSDGRFSFLLGPGRYDIRGPRQVASRDFEITDQEALTFNYHSIRPEKGTLKGFVTTTAPLRPVADATVTGIYQSPRANYSGVTAQTTQSGRFEVDRGLHRMTLYAKNKEGTHGGVTTIGPDDKSVRIAMKPFASATGRLVDDNGEPMPNREIVYGVRVHEGDQDAPWRTAFGKTVRTDADGRFIADQLVQGHLYWFNIKTGEWSSRSVGHLRAESGAQFELGNLVVTRGGAVSLAMRLEGLCRSEHTATERLGQAIRDSTLSYRRILVVFADLSNPVVASYYSALRARDVRVPLVHFRPVWVSRRGPNAPEAVELAEQLQVDPADSGIMIAALNEDGELQGTLADPVFIEGKVVDTQKLTEFLKRHAPVPPNAETLFNNALATAKRDQKKVLFVQQTAGSPPSLKLLRFLERRGDEFAKDYVVVHIDRRWPGGQKIAEQIRDGDARRTPWFGVLDSTGKLLTRSDESGEDIAVSLQHHAEMFGDILRKHGTRLNETDIAVILDDLRNP